MRRCDNAMTAEAAPIVANQNWGWGYVIWWGIELHRSPDPGTNEHWLQVQLSDLASRPGFELAQQIWIPVSAFGPYSSVMCWY